MLNGKGPVFGMSTGEKNHQWIVGYNAETTGIKSVCMKGSVKGCIKKIVHLFLKLFSKFFHMNVTFFTAFVSPLSVEY